MAHKYCNKPVTNMLAKIFVDESTKTVFSIDSTTVYRTEISSLLMTCLFSLIGIVWFTYSAPSYRVVKFVNPSDSKNLYLTLT